MQIMVSNEYFQMGHRPNGCAFWMVRLDTSVCLLIPETKVAIYLTKNTCVDYYIDSTSRPAEARKLKPTRPSGLRLHCSKKNLWLVWKEVIWKFLPISTREWPENKTELASELCVIYGGFWGFTYGEFWGFRRWYWSGDRLLGFDSVQDLDWNHVSK